MVVKPLKAVTKKQWAITLRIIDETNKSLECILDNALIIGLLGFTYEDCEVNIMNKY